MTHIEPGDTTADSTPTWNARNGTGGGAVFAAQQVALGLGGLQDAHQHRHRLVLSGAGRIGTVGEGVVRGVGGVVKGRRRGWSVRVGGDAAAASSGEGSNVSLSGSGGTSAGVAAVAVAQLDGGQGRHMRGGWERVGGGEGSSEGLGQVRGGVPAAAVSLGGGDRACCGDGSRCAGGVGSVGGWRGSIGGRSGQDADRRRGRGV